MNEINNKEQTLNPTESVATVVISRNTERYGSGNTIVRYAVCRVDNDVHFRRWIFTEARSYADICNEIHGLISGSLLGIRRTEIYWGGHDDIKYPR